MEGAAGAPGRVTGKQGRVRSMITFLFWNLNKQPLEDRVSRLATKYSVDVLIPAECEVTPSVMVGALNTSGGKTYAFPASVDTKIKVFTTLPQGDMQERYADPSGDMTIRLLKVGGPPGVLLAAVHLPSKQDWSDSDQGFWTAELARQIRQEEGQVWENRTILVGDFNMNPFDHGITGAQGFHGVMTLDVARRWKREIKGRSYRFFYNPMWGLFGDRTHGPPGTFYLSASKPVNYFWNMYDQVMLRPAVAEKLSDVRIIDHDGVDSLLTKFNLPDRTLGSDHLPVLFELDL
jgi:hypothetical protein